MMKLVTLLVIVGCNSTPKSAPAVDKGSDVAPTPTAPAAPAAPVEDVDCSTASKAFAKKMAAAPGNILSDAKPDDGLIYYTAISMEDYCTGEPGNSIVPWTAEERACVKNEANAESCFKGNALSQVKAGLAEVVTSALANKKKNEAGSAAEKPAP